MKKLCIVLLALTASLNISADDNKGFWRGDVNGDNKVNVTDLAQLVAILNGKKDKNERADVNNDGKSDITDITSLLDILQGNTKTTWQESPKTIEFTGTDGDEKADDEQF